MKQVAILLVLALSATASAQPSVKNKAYADKWRTYAKIQIENATNDLPTVTLAKTKLSDDLTTLEADFAARKAKMDAADVKKCETHIAIAKGRITLTTNTIAKAQTELDKAVKHFTASTTAYSLGLWGVAGNKATEADIEGGNANRRLERSLEIIDVGYEHWAIIDKVLAKYR